MVHWLVGTVIALAAVLVPMAAILVDRSGAVKLRQKPTALALVPSTSLRIHEWIF